MVQHLTPNDSPEPPVSPAAGFARRWFRPPLVPPAIGSVSDQCGWCWARFRHVLPAWPGTSTLGMRLGRRSGGTIACPVPTALVP